MFGWFTEKMARVMALSLEEARRLGQSMVGTEHLLLGLLGETSGKGAEILGSFGMSLADARERVEKITGRGTAAPTAVELPLTPRSKRILEHGWRSAQELNQEQYDTEHLLLGLLAEGDGVAVRVIESYGITLQSAKEKASSIIMGISKS